MSTPERVIIVQTAFLGDVILTLPLCAAVRHALPDAEIVLVTTPAAAEFVRGLSVVDTVVAYDKRGQHRSIASQRGLAASLRDDSLSMIALVPHKSLRTALFVRSLKARRVITYSDAASRWFATDVVRYPTLLHDARRHLSLLSPLAPTDTLPLIEALLPIRLSATLPAELSPWIATSDAPRVVLAPATVWPTKQWPVEHMRELARKAVHEGWQVAVIGDASVRGCMDGVAGVHDLIGRTTLRQAASIIANADAVVANDSAPVHLASLQNVGVVAIFGPTVPEFGFGPLGTRSRVVQLTDLECRPCSSHGGASCPLGTHACMKGIGADLVFETVQSILAHDVNRHAKPHKEDL